MLYWTQLESVLFEYFRVWTKFDMNLSDSYLSEFELNQCDSNFIFVYRGMVSFFGLYSMSVFMSNYRSCYLFTSPEGGSNWEFKKQGISNAIKPSIIVPLSVS